LSSGTLSALQQRILKALAGRGLGWVLTGGGALAGFHLAHRITRDLDLFWHGRRLLKERPREVQAWIEGEGLRVDLVQSGVTFCRLRVSDDSETCVVDLVAEPAEPIDLPLHVCLEGRDILVDTTREILANKLCALLSRSELRDLLDVRALLAAGADLETGLHDAARKDGGFSALTLAWVLRGFDVEAAARASGWGDEEVEQTASFRDELIERLTMGAAPE